MKKHILTLALAATLLASSCKRNNSSFDGPSLSDLNGQFGMLQPFQASKSSVDFSKAETVGFTAKFTKLCDWTIRIKGSNSGAQKFITGKSRIIDVSTATWNGSTTVFPMFKNEPCVATLLINGVTDTFNITVGITGVRVPSGFVVANFESGMNTKWTTFIQSGGGMDFKIHNDQFNVEGSNYFNMAGTVNWDWLIGMVDFPASAYGKTTYPLSTVGEDVYFNCLIYGKPNTNESRILFQFREDDNANGKFDAASDDQYDNELRVTWEGWKLVSFKYTDLLHLVNGVPAPNNGNRRHNPNSLVMVSLLHLANPSGGAASTKIDCIMFTEKGPLEL